MEITLFSMLPIYINAAQHGTVLEDVLFICREHQDNELHRVYRISANIPSTNRYVHNCAGKPLGDF